MSIPSQIGSGERLGRRISSRSHLRLVRRGDAPISLFMREDTRFLSVDRLRDDWLADATDVAVGYDNERGRTFYGWAAVSLVVSARNDREVESSPQEGNQYHADIVLPLMVMSDKSEYERHAVELAAKASWQHPVVDE